MPFILLTFFAAFSIEAIGTVVSVIGLSTLFGANPIIIALAVVLDIGKLVVITLLYGYWQKLNRLMRTYGLIAAVITMVITSAGAAGYLSAEFQKAVVGTQEGQLKIQVIKDEQGKLEARKKQIDDGIAAIPDRYSANQKIRLMNQFKEEQRLVTARLNEISQQLPTLQISQISVEAKAGPILYISKAFDVSIEEAVKWVILMIIFVFDPLAVFLIIAGNFLLFQRRKEMLETPPPSPPSPLISEPEIEKIVAAPTMSREMVAPTVSAVIAPNTVAVEEAKIEGEIVPAVVPAILTETVVAPVDVDTAPQIAEEVITLAKQTKTIQEEVAAKVEIEEVITETIPETIPETIVEAPAREQITKSTLGIPEQEIVEPKEDTKEVGLKTGVFKSGVFKPGIYRSGR